MKEDGHTFTFVAVFFHILIDTDEYTPIAVDAFIQIVVSRLLIGTEKKRVDYLCKATCDWLTINY